ncbi:MULTISPECIES: DUF2589 domain-containing protein [Musicola]|uniref:DUF2589 domain-containing protein n=1 Tax=Musicola paradisiaca (strain Ech703) TaxID=579405 RepID=C6C830_MUSP7|nr:MULTISPECIES: DUF2589 domain-containing protein [Musicola]ACS84175.1 conserved hypothetical protein [Musicola paradisiaca Ech703]
MADSSVQDSATAQLGNIPFGTLIGGPLNAAVEAQANAAKSSVDFIRQVAIGEDGQIRSVVFKYEKEGQNATLSVPVLTIVPIPYLRIDYLDIAFKANISASTTTSDKSSSSSQLDVKANASWSGWGAKVNFSAAYSSKKDSSSARDSKYNVEYTMDINLHAVQDDMPAGMNKVLNILQECITSKPASATTTTASA